MLIFKLKKSTSGLLHLSRHIFAVDCEDEAKAWLDEMYESNHLELDELVAQKEWEYQTNINDETSVASVLSKLEHNNMLNS
jgi:hypothetical protein